MDFMKLSILLCLIIVVTTVRAKQNNTNQDQLADVSAPAEDPSSVAVSELKDDQIHDNNHRVFNDKTVDDGEEPEYENDVSEHHEIVEDDVLDDDVDDDDESDLGLDADLVDPSVIEDPEFDRKLDGHKFDDGVENLLQHGEPENENDDEDIDDTDYHGYDEDDYEEFNKNALNDKEFGRSEHATDNPDDTSTEPTTELQTECILNCPKTEKYRTTWHPDRHCCLAFRNECYQAAYECKTNATLKPVENEAKCQSTGYCFFYMVSQDLKWLQI